MMQYASKIMMMSGMRYQCDICNVFYAGLRCFEIWFRNKDGKQKYQFQSPDIFLGGNDNINERDWFEKLN